MAEERSPHQRTLTTLMNIRPMIDHPFRHGESLGTWRRPRYATLGNPGERTIFSVAERSTMQGWIACHEELDALEIVAIDGLLELADFLQGIDVGLEFRPTGKPVETCDFELRVGKRFRATRHEKIFGLILQLAEVGALRKRTPLIRGIGRQDRKSTRLNSRSRLHLVCRLLLEKKKTHR